MDSKISGAGVISGGEYDSITISGSGKVTGAVRCTEIKGSGASRFEGAVNCSGAVHVSGAARFADEISADELKASGAVHCEGAVRCKTVKFSGAANCCDVEAESFRSAGALECGGLINAEKVLIRFDGQSSVKAIGGTAVDIAPDGTKTPEEETTEFKLFGIFSFKKKRVSKGRKPGSFECESIEGDEIALEKVTGVLVSGKNVKIGDGCVIEKLIYSGDVDISDSAVVKSVEKSE